MSDHDPTRDDAPDVEQADDVLGFVFTTPNADDGWFVLDARKD